LYLRVPNFSPDDASVRRAPAGLPFLRRLPKGPT
jgi:hypothetical protein